MTAHLTGGTPLKIGLPRDERTAQQNPRDKQADKPICKRLLHSSTVARVAGKMYRLWIRSLSYTNYSTAEYAPSQILVLKYTTMNDEQRTLRIAHKATNRVPWFEHGTIHER